MSSKIKFVSSKFRSFIFIKTNHTGSFFIFRFLNHKFWTEKSKVSVEISLSQCVVKHSCVTLSKLTWKLRHLWEKMIKCRWKKINDVSNNADWVESYTLNVIDAWKLGIVEAKQRHRCFADNEIQLEIMLFSYFYLRWTWAKMFFTFSTQLHLVMKRSMIIFIHSQKRNSLPQYIVSFRRVST